MYVYLKIKIISQQNLLKQRMNYFFVEKMDCLSIRIFFLLLIMSSTLNINAQQKLTKRQFIADSIKIMRPKLIRPQVRLDNRLTFLNGQKLSIFGVDAGVLLKAKLRVTLGYYEVSDKLTSITKVLNQVEYNGQYDLTYGALNTEFIYKNTRYISLGMPLEFGFGGNKLNYKSTKDNTETGKQSGFIAMAYVGLSATFKPMRWIGLKGAVGFRKVLFNKVKDLSFDGIYSSVGIVIDFVEIVRDFEMYKLKKKYRKKANSLGTAIDVLTD